MFARWGLPHQLVTDNGPQFTSLEFENFIKSNGVIHIRSAPYHPATNGHVERFVQSFKQALHISKEERRSLNHRVATFLFQYRNTAHATIEILPAELMIGHIMRNRLDLLHPNLRNTVVNKQTCQVMTMSAAVPRDFLVGESVMVQDYATGCNNTQTSGPSLLPSGSSWWNSSVAKTC